MADSSGEGFPATRYTIHQRCQQPWPGFFDRCTGYSQPPDTQIKDTQSVSLEIPLPFLYSPCDFSPLRCAVQFSRRCSILLVKPSAVSDASQSGSPASSDLPQTKETPTRMRLGIGLLGLPASILMLLVSYTTSGHAVPDEPEQTPARWPWNLPKHVKYWPEDSTHRRRRLEDIEEHLRISRTPVGVMKMSDDEGEKFYMEYWQFEGELEQTSMSDTLSATLRTRDEEEEAKLLANVSAAMPFRPPFALHTEHSEDLKARSAMGRAAAAALAILQKRAYTCPSGTSDCSNIGYPNSCCATGETCYPIQDTGLGPVGCCPTGTTCGGTIASCSSPNTPCAQDLGGGCCIPNYVCFDVGCVLEATVTQTNTISASSTSRTTVAGGTVPSATAISSATSTYTGLQTTLSCSSGSNACPVTLGGGCCPSGRICGSSICIDPASTTTTSTSNMASTTGSGVVPIRPTGETTTTTASSGSAATTCPVGFYACEAYYQGGCCRTGRDCHTTSCPPTSSTTIISSGVTVVVPVGSAASVATPTGACANGWATCAASLGGNCCPSGYACGTASCSSVATSSNGGAATEVAQKKSPNSGASSRWRGSGWTGIVLGLGLVVGLL